MRIYGMEKLSLVDYDGKVACTLFTGSCNFRCGFCHNSPLVLDYQILPVLEEEEIFAYLKKRKGILEGVCISGGEPTLEKDLACFIEKVKDLGYSVKLDSNGTNPEVIKSLFENGLIDYLAMDIKNDKEHYASIIGFDKFDTKKVEKTVDFLLNNNFPYEFRTTLIKEFHTKENVKLIGEWIKGANKYFLQKFKDSDSCIKSGLSPIDDKTVLEFKDILTKYVQNTFTRGYNL